ncbi:hypothetical protein CsSME_00004021 [Camellia sinensis var. sinensis]
MVRFSHIVVVVLNLPSLLWSILIIFLTLSAITQAPEECYSESPVVGLAYGIFLFTLSMVALIGAIRANRCLLSIYVWMLFGWIVSLVCFSILFFILSKVSIEKATKDHREYDLNEYPDWLRRFAVEGGRWDVIKKCMVRGQICEKLLLEKDPDENGDLRIKESPILYSCCQPPLYCGFVNMNDTLWEIPKTGLASKDSDCFLWENNLDQVCYDCSSCKAGYIRILKEDWSTEAYFDAIMALFVTIILSIAFCAFRQAPMKNHTSNNDNTSA